MAARLLPTAQSAAGGPRRQRRGGHLDHGLLVVPADLDPLASEHRVHLGYLHLRGHLRMRAEFSEDKHRVVGARATRNKHSGRSTSASAFRIGERKQNTFPVKNPGRV